ncbi:MAG: response regulator [Saprospiraceae bacterium]
MKTKLYLFLLLFPQLLLGQKELFDIQHFSIKDGLPDNQTLHIEQDKDGYIWGNSIGLLFRYDGYQFKIYRKQKLGVSGLEFVNFTIDDAGFVWYFDFNQLPLNIRILNPKQNKVIPIDIFFKNKLPFPANEVTNIYNDKQLGTVILTQNSGFFTYQNGQFKKQYQHYTSISYSKMRGTVDDDIWFCHQDTLFQLSPKGKLNFTVNNDFILDILPFKKSLYVWYGDFFDDEKDINFSELVNYVKKEKPRYERIKGKTIKALEDKTPTLAYHSFFSDTEDYQWIIQKKSNKINIIGKSPDNRILFNEPLSLNIQGKNNSQVFSNIRELYGDQQNNIWATSDNGIYRISRRKIPFKSYLSKYSTRGIYRLDTQLLVNHNEVSIINLITQEEVDFKLPLKRITFFKDENKLWIGSEYGITYWNPDWNEVDWNVTDWKKSDFYFRELKGYQNIIPFRPKNTDRLWMGTSKGMVYLNPKSDTITAFLSSNERLNTSTIRYIYENQKGLWLVTNQGLFLMTADGKVLKELNTQNGFSSNDLYHLHEDKNDVFWLGSADVGLIRWNPTTNEQQIFGREQGFLNENIYAVYEDDDNFLWLPTDYGLIRFNKATYEVNTYLEKHGLPNNEFNTFSHYQDSLGNLYFGGINGLIAFQPKDFIKNTSTDIPLHLTAYKVQSEDKENVLDFTDKVLETNTLTFRPNDKFFEVHFSLMDFKNNRKRLYAYQIKGYDNTWRYTTDNFIRINSLPYGNYELVIKGQVDGVAWSSNELKLKTIVLRPFYLQWWFIILSVVIGIISIFLFLKYRTESLRQEQIRLEKIVVNRTAKIQEDKAIITAQAEALQEMDKIKTKFFSNITHEFRTPLTLILGPAKQLQEIEKTPQKQQRLKSILKNAQHLLSLINQLLDLSKLESRKMAVSWQYGNIIEYTEELLNSFLPLAKQKQQQLIFSSDETIWETYFDQEKWNKIIFNLLSNAIKYTEVNGKIELEINKITQVNQEIIYLKVNDNGIGINPNNLTQIFNRFYQVDDTVTRFQEGAGIGLALVKELIELQNGIIEVQSTIGKGTTFEVKIPIPQGDIKISSFKNIKSNTSIIETQPIINAEIDNQSIDVDEKLEILIIEDNADMRDYISSCLDHTKYQISTANDGEAGIEKSLEIIPDLIISDVMMPKKDGFEVVTALRQHIATSHIPIILLTAKAALDSRLEGLNRGADVYLTKPFSPKELVIRIQKLIELRQLIQQRYQNKTTDRPIEPLKSYEQEDVFITELKAYILKNIEDPNLSVKTIGEHFYISRTQLYRKVKALTNETTITLIQKIRLETAFELMENSTNQLSLSEIAYQTGFSSPSYFSRLFKRVYGKSPSEVVK